MNWDAVYDDQSDVMYIHVRPNRAADRAFEDDDNLVWRYDGDQVIGVTILDFLRRAQSASSRI